MASMGQNEQMNRLWSPFGGAGARGGRGKRAWSLRSEQAEYSVGTCLKTFSCGNTALATYIRLMERGLSIGILPPPNNRAAVASVLLPDLSEPCFSFPKMGPAKLVW